VQPELRATQLEVLTATVERALARSAETLSEMSGVQISISSSEVEVVPLAEVPAAVGQPDEPAIGIYVGIEGDGAGYLLLLLEEMMASNLAALLLCEPAGSVDLHGELAVSALAEAGNVSCSAFMNALGEATQLTLMATPPVVIGDMRGAIMDVAIADIAQTGDEALLIKTNLRRCDGPDNSSLVNARLLAIPTPETLERIVARLGAVAAGG
jgi:chemotaxis protein CheC